MPRTYEYHDHKAHLPEYQAWCDMKRRCYHPERKDYKYYGGRGITVCEEWMNSFVKFLEDVGEKPEAGMQLDRIDNNGNYEPGNVRWTTAYENMHNRRNSR